MDRRYRGSPPNFNVKEVPAFVLVKRPSLYWCLSG